MIFKKIGCFLLFLVPWFFSSFLPIDFSYYGSLSLPFFAPKPIVFILVWPILYLLIAYSIYQVIKESTSNYKIYLVINYFSNQLFTVCFFVLKNPFLALVDTIIVLISSMYLYVETKQLDKRYANYLIPYIVWNFFAFLLIFWIFVIN